MAFISSSNTSSGKGEVPTASVPTASSQVSTVSTKVAAASLSHDTICAYIATQSSGSQIKYEDITQIDEDDIEEMDIKWNLALLSMRADRASRSQDRGKRESYMKDPKVEEPAPKALMALDGIGATWLMKIKTMHLWQMMKNTENLNTKINKLNEELSDCETDLYNYKRGLPEFVDDTVTDYSRPTPSVDVSKDVRSDLDGNNTSIFEQRGLVGNVLSRPMISFVKETGCHSISKVNNIEKPRKPTVKYAEMYRDASKSPKVKGNQRNWNNLKFQQLGKDFLMQNKACYKCGYFDHLASNCGIWVAKGETWPRGNYSQNNVKSPSTHKSMTPRAVLLKSGSKPIVVNKPKMNVAQPTMTSFKIAHSKVKRPFERKTTAKNQIWVPKVPTGRTKIPTVGSNVPTAKPTGAADLGNKGKAVKASVRWIWKPKENTSGQGSNFNGVSVTFKKYQYIDTQGRLKSVMAWVPKEN
ncbi:ribonuclease H-like domain-containing protein [Tanacetum coccineum]